MKTTLAVGILFASAVLQVPAAYAQSCTLTPTVGAVSLGAFGTLSPGGVLPEIPQTVGITASGNCGALTATATGNTIASPGSCGVGGSSGYPWLTVAAGANAVTFIALSNSTSVVRTGAIAVTSSTGGSASIAVTEAADAEPLEYRQVRALYESILGRDPDLGGYGFWTGAGANALGYMADDFLTSPEAFNTDFAVIAAYQAASGAPPTFARFAAAVAAVRTGNQTVEGLFGSLIAGNAGYSAATLYQNLLNRAPTFTEVLAYQSGAAAAFDAIVGFPAANTPVGAANNEFQSTGTFANHVTSAGDHTNALYIYMLYFTILDRDPDQGGLAFWEGIANGGGAGILFQGSAGLAARIGILGTGVPGEGFTGSVEFEGAYCPFMQ